MIRRLADLVMLAAGVCFLGALLTPWRWLLAAAAVLCFLGLLNDPTETEEQRQYRHAQRKPDRVDRLIAEHLKAEADRIEPQADGMAGLDMRIGRAWPSRCRTARERAEDFALWTAEQDEWRSQL
ncbi:MAG TPA: hypothetical protein VN714_02650 [Trebonia sp.]|nr:hypothetical protein [Trebonia sp.]